MMEGLASGLDAGETPVFKPGTTEVEKQPDLDPGCLEVVDHLCLMLGGEGFHRLEFNDHLFFNGRSA